MKTTWHRILACVFFVSAIVAGVLFYSHWLGMKQENSELSQTRDNLKRRADELQKQLDYKNEYYNKLITDKDFSERVIKERLGYAHPDDIVFRFKDSTPSELDDGFEKTDFEEPKQKKSFFDKILAFFGLVNEEKKITAHKPINPEKIVPEFRVDMTDASIAAVENKKNKVAQIAPNLAINNSASGDTSAPIAPPPEVRLLSDIGKESALVSVEMKPVKVKLGYSNTNIVFVSRVAKKPVRFISR